MKRSYSDRDTKKTIKDPIKKRFTEAQQAMQLKLVGARFRQLNELMYSKSGAVMFEKFKKSPELYKKYHEGYNLQANSWKRHPTSLIIKWIMQKVPENHVIADLGCGDARISQAFPTYKIYSVDFLPNPQLNIISANLSNLPLETNSCDVVIFSLSLMGLDWPSFIYEAFRIIRKPGILKIAEAQSRITNISQFIQAIEKLGAKCKKKLDVDSYFIILDFHVHSYITSVEKIDGHLLKPCLYKKR